MGALALFECQLGLGQVPLQTLGGAPDGRAPRHCDLQRWGSRQSMSSGCIDSLAAVTMTLPPSPHGPIKRPRSRRLANRQGPWPSPHRFLIRSPHRPRRRSGTPRRSRCGYPTAELSRRQDRGDHPRGRHIDRARNGDPGLSADMTETPAHLPVNVGRRKVRTRGERERLDDF